MNTSLSNADLSELLKLMQQFKFNAELNKLRKIANAWRAKFNREGGFVFIYEGKAYAWRNVENHPGDSHTECPNVIAIAEDGTAWRAVGGDSYNGAERWEALEPEGEQPQASPPTQAAVSDDRQERAPASDAAAPASSSAAQAMGTGQRYTSTSHGHGQRHTATSHGHGQRHSGTSYGHRPAAQQHQPWAWPAAQQHQPRAWPAA